MVLIFVRILRNVSCMCMKTVNFSLVQQLNLC